MNQGTFRAENRNRYFGSRTVKVSTKSLMTAWVGAEQRPRRDEHEGKAYAKPHSIAVNLFTKSHSLTAPQIHSQYKKGEMGGPCFTERGKALAALAVLPCMEFSRPCFMDAGLRFRSEVGDSVPSGRQFRHLHPRCSAREARE